MADVAEPLDVERLLQRVAAGIDVSGADRVLASVTAQLAGDAPSPMRHRAPFTIRRRWLAVAAAAVLIATSVLAISPGTRAAVARFFGVPGVEVIQVDALPPAARAAALPDLGLGTPTTVAAARTELGYAPRQFTGERLAKPAAVYLDGTALSYVYRPTADLPETRVAGVGLLLTQFDGFTDFAVVKKVTVRDNEIEQVSVGGRPGLWIRGEHAVAYLAGDREHMVEVPVRLAGNVLVWQDDDVTLRLEADVSRDQAIALAEQLHPS